MKNIHVLPTNKPSMLCIDRHGKLLYYPENNWFKRDEKAKAQHIYITSDEDIREGDWFIELDLKGTRSSYINKPYLCDIGNTDCFILTKNNGNFPFPEHCKKIILTTDQDLIKAGVQAIDDEFLKQFVKNPSCEFVEILKFADSRTTFVYKITTPQEETIEEAARKYYENNIDVSNIPREHYEIEIQDLMIGFASEWQLKTFK